MRLIALIFLVGLVACGDGIEKKVGPSNNGNNQNNVNNLNNPQLDTTFTNGLASIDHNMMVRNDYVYQANYSSGLRIWDANNINNIQEVGFFDTRPENDATNFEGAWGVSSLLPSGIVVVSDRQRGLFVLDPSGAVP